MRVEVVLALVLEVALVLVFMVEVAFWLLDEEDLLVEATFCATLTFAEALLAGMSLAPQMPLDLTTEPTDFFM